MNLVSTHCGFDKVTFGHRAKLTYSTIGPVSPVPRLKISHVSTLTFITNGVSWEKKSQLSFTSALSHLSPIVLEASTAKSSKPANPRSNHHHKKSRDPRSLAPSTTHTEPPRTQKKSKTKKEKKNRLQSVSREKESETGGGMDPDRRRWIHKLKKNQKPKTPYLERERERYRRRWIGAEPTSKSRR
jgi:hypothetical protein